MHCQIFSVENIISKMVIRIYIINRYRELKYRNIVVWIVYLITGVNHLEEGGLNFPKYIAIPLDLPLLCYPLAYGKFYIKVYIKFTCNGKVKVVLILT